MKMIFRHAIPLLLSACPGTGANALYGAAPENELSDQAINERIQQHRTAEATLTVMDADGKPLANAPIALRQTRHQFLFGCSMLKFDRCRTPEENEAYKTRFKELMNFATLGLYWGVYEPREGQLDDARWHAVAQWCKDNGVRAKGHPLVWTGEPRWLLDKSPDEGEAALWRRVRREVSGFAGLVDTWDAINEPCVGVSQAKERNAQTALRLYERDGAAAVIAKAFATARAANPQATLILNDFNVTDKFANLARNCLAASVTIDAIGLQSHMHTGYWGPQKTWDTCERFAPLGKPLHFTEVTIMSGRQTAKEGNKATFTSQPGDEERQAAQVAEFYRILFSHPSVEAITWWDFSDQGAWFGAPAGLLRKDMSPKPAYEALHRLIKGEWWTGPLELKTDAQGRVKFRGFLGDYAVESTRGQGSFPLPKAGAAAVSVPLGRK